jgi:hypothetical protein
MVGRLVATVVLLLAVAASAPIGPRPVPTAAGASRYSIVEIFVDACRPAPPPGPALPGGPTAVEPSGEACLQTLGAYLDQIRPYPGTWRRALTGDLSTMGLTDVAVWGPDAGVFFAGRSGTTCVVGELGEGGHRVERVAVRADSTCDLPPWAG